MNDSEVFENIDYREHLGAERERAAASQRPMITVDRQLFMMLIDYHLEDVDKTIEWQLDQKGWHLQGESE